MTDKLTKARRSRNMAAIRSKDMKPERIVRSLVHKLGYRFRLHRKDLPGKPDLVFPAKRKVIFVHGCFWHQHSKKSCADARLPKSNTSYWHQKLAANVARDRKAQTQLRQTGWAVLTIWECETALLIDIERRVRTFLN
ncbi:MAG: very short patch repair endonuclease [Micropepsaceae bacterium]